MKKIVLFVMLVLGCMAIQQVYGAEAKAEYTKEVKVHAESINRMCAKFLSSDSEEERYTLAKYIKRHNWEVPKELWSPYVPVVLKEIDTLHILDR